MRATSRPRSPSFRGGERAHQLIQREQVAPGGWSWLVLAVIDGTADNQQKSNQLSFMIISLLWLDYYGYSN